MNRNIHTLTGLFLAFATEEVVFVILKQTAASTDGASCRNLPDYCRSPVPFAPHRIRVVPCTEQVVVWGEERIWFVEEGLGR